VSDLLVLGQDPGFGGGAGALMEAFLAAARGLGRDPELLYTPHPRFHPEISAPVDRLETVRLLRGARTLAPALRRPEPLWVVASLAQHGYAAVRSGRPYSCWLATSLGEENRGRLPGLAPSRRLAAHVNAPFLARLERAVLRSATRVYGISEASRESLVRAAGRDEVGVLPLPVDLDRFAPEADERWLARLERPVLAFVGRGDDPRKNVMLAFAATAEVRKAVPTATLRLIGPRPPASLPEGVEALGEVVSLAEPLRECALLLLPSRQEGFGLAAAEALAAGVPVVSTPSGGPEELLRESGAGVVTSGWDARELADTVVELLSDRERLLELRRRGIEYVRRAHAPATLLARLQEAIGD
jgi:glycosyltransferase involved in cell wall biosynthesis